MTEIFADISDDVRSKAEIMWKIALGQDNPIKAAQFLHDMIDYYSNRWTEEEVNFLDFYFQTQMEMNKQ